MMSSNEKYELEVGDKGLDYDILDVSFNPSTQAFMLSAGLKPGMKVLDAGCGSGAMTVWLAKQVGSAGHVTAIDNSESQLNYAIRRFQKANVTNVTTKVLSVYDIADLKEKYDLIYCRFVLHHVFHPRNTIKLFYENLNPNGLYIGEEGRVGAAFAYPPSFAWQGHIPEPKHPDQEEDGLGRDGDFGIKLFYYCKQAGFDIMDCRLIQPLLWKKEHKQGLLTNLDIYKKTDLAHGTTEAEWQHKYDETQRLINDDSQIIAFYGSCQIAAKK